MILSDRDLLAALEGRLIFIDPQPDDSLWTSTAVDLTLDSGILRWREKDETTSPTGQELIVCPAQPAFKVQEMMKDPAFAITESLDPHGYVLQPGKFILGYTREKIKLPIGRESQDGWKAKVRSPESASECMSQRPQFTPALALSWKKQTTLGRRFNWRSSTSVRCPSGWKPACRSAN